MLMRSSRFVVFPTRRTNISLLLAPLLLVFSQLAHQTHGFLNCEVLDTTTSTSENDSSADSDMVPIPCTHFQNTPFVETYREWYETNEVDAEYPNSVFLKGADPDAPEDGAAIHWKIVDGTHIELAIAVRAIGWLGFGIAEAGGMLGTDMLLFEAALPYTVQDAYTSDKRIPIPDDCSQDWEWIDSAIYPEEGFMMLKVRRLLDTGDPQDHVIDNDASLFHPPHRVIAAWGDSREVGHHGMKRARGAIRFFGHGDEQTTFEKTMAAKAEGSFVVGARDHAVDSNVNTEYLRTCVDREMLLEQGVPDTSSMLNIIGMEAILQKGNEAYIHHFIVFGALDVKCKQRRVENEMVYMWAPGTESSAMPDNLGVPLFGEDGFRAFEIEIHYNNPNRTPHIVDNSGMRLYWTSEPRKHQVGLMALGDPYLGLGAQKVGKGYSRHLFDCPGSCSASVGREITVLKEYFHMHTTGARMVNSQIRNGEVIHESSVEYYEFKQSGNVVAKQDPFEVQPGDGFRTTCYFDEQDHSHVFGKKSTQEMCIAYLYYYPRQMLTLRDDTEPTPFGCSYNMPLADCGASYSYEILPGIEDMGRSFGLPRDDSCAAASSSVAEKLESSDLYITIPGNMLYISIPSLSILFVVGYQYHWRKKVRT